MVWNSVGDFLHMGGYGLYVWGSVVITAAFMLIEVGILVVRRRTILEYLGRVRDGGLNFGDENGGGDETAA
jgi:heme exporter protein D